MKKITYSLFLLASIILAACNDVLPGASWDLYEIENLQASALDASVQLRWAAVDEAEPTGYYVSWEPSSATASSGNMTVGNTETSALVEGLQNKVQYTFSVQAIYGSRRSGAATVKATPVSSCVPPTNLVVASGDKRAKLTWTKPTSTLVTGYQITVSPGDKVIKIDNPDTESYIVTGLENSQRYTITLQAVYTKGLSEEVTEEVTPGAVSPIVGAKTVVLAGESLSLTYNDMYFMGDVQSVVWDFGDGTQATGATVEKTYTGSGNNTVQVTVTYADNSTETATVQIVSIASIWSISTGYVKASNPVFSRDGKTFYLPTSNKKGDLVAYNTTDGSKKWTFGISKITYGGGSAVGPDGTIYQGARDATLYALNSDGSKKWTYATGSTNVNLDCFPAVSKDGNTVYVIDGDNKLHAINTANGSARWTQALEGTANKAAAVAIDKAGHIYAGTRSYIYAFDASGNELWKTAAAVTEIGSFALDGSTLYAAQVGGAGLVAVETSTGQAKWSQSANGDSYGPIVGKDGTVYFVDKGGKSLHAVSAEGSLKWTFKAAAALTYCFPCLDSNGIIYFGSATGILYAVDTATGKEAWKMSPTGTGDNAKIMAGLTIGSDQRLYVGYIGGNVICIPIYAGPETSTWSCRGGNIHGTNLYQ